jgi:hypothetical protein
MIPHSSQKMTDGQLRERLAYLGKASRVEIECELAWRAHRGECISAVRRREFLPAFLLAQPRRRSTQ